MTCVRKLVDMLRQHNLNYSFLQQLEEQGEYAKQLLVYGKCTLEEINALWNEGKSKCQEETKKVLNVKTVLAHVRDEVEESYLPDGFDELLDHVENMVENVEKGNITARQSMSNSLWEEDMANLPDICGFLKSAVSSRMFWNLCKEPICKKYFFAKDGDIDTAISSEKSEITKYQENTRSCIVFLTNLQNNGQDLYKNAWFELQENADLEMSKVLAMIYKTDINWEIDFAESCFGQNIKVDVRETLLRINKIGEIKMIVDAMQMSLKAFEMDVSADQGIYDAISSFDQLYKADTSNLRLSTVSSSLKTVFNVAEHLSPVTISVLHSLGNSSLLLDFLRKIVDDDIRNLIDAVEDISEQYVRESTVSGLIEVKQFLQPLLKPDLNRTGRMLFQTIEEQSAAFDKTVASLPDKIEDCMLNLHNLKSLYNNVANRGEQTKEIILCIVKESRFNFHLDPDSHVCRFMSTYTQSDVKRNHSATTLVDLRSRALLLMNSEKTGTYKRSGGDNLMHFVNYVDICLDISETVQTLFVSGNINYSSFKRSEPQTKLVELKEALDSDLQQWQSSLEAERESYYLMNFVQGIQIHTFYAYLENDSLSKEVASMMKFIHPEMNIDFLKENYDKQKDTADAFADGDMLACMGYALHAAYEDLPAFQRNIHVTETKGKRITEKVRVGKLLIADLEEGSLSVVKTVLSLYSNSTQKYPEANQMLFCTYETSWNELQLLIRRCLGAYNFYGYHILFCIANVEMLPNAMQFKLVEALRDLDGKEQFMLAVVCRGSKSHPFKDELGEFVMTIRPASDQAVRDIFKHECPFVCTITSDVAGLGKSTMVHTTAHNNEKGVVTLHISGPIRKGKLVEGLRDLHIEPYHVLHLDIGSVDNPIALDTFLFELIILRYVTTGTVAVSLSTSHIFIEIANTINDSLRNSLQTAVSFARDHIQWRDYSNFIVSHEIHSAIQVVCQFLQGLDVKSLDKSDIIFSGDNAVTIISASRCRYLLKQCIGSTKDMSFSVVNIFLQVLSDQFKKMSCSTFFRTSRITDMIGHKTVPVIRSTLVRALVEVSKEFSSRSVAAYRATQYSTLTIPSGKEIVENRDYALTDLASMATKRIESMIRWEDSNHLIYVFHNQNIQTISPMYRDISKVPTDIRSLFERQMNKDLQDYKSLSQSELQTMLQRVARTNPLQLPCQKLKDLAKEYALTPDNLLKMVLIMLRIKANVPVIVMGETGCGKTSLVRYLSAICEVSFQVFNIHAGVEEQAIINMVLKCHKAALASLDVEQWLFLDEINTCEYIGLIADVVCHHRCVGNKLAPNLIVMCACNPYKLRSASAISTAGLQGKVKTDELSRLVYRVLPLPEMMVDYVWDFGSLSEVDEVTYIKQMVLDVFPDSKDNHDLFSELLASSQHFVRDHNKAECSVSLRDVQRCRILTKWFLRVLKIKGSNVSASITVTAIILALAHCYHSRFADKSVRKAYREELRAVFEKHKCNFKEAVIHDIIKGEQRDILNKMDLPPGTAKNTALQENVFVLLVCILNRIPVFLVGKPGCSKSLAMQVIRSNLRGKDSREPFFKTLPQLYCVSFQGSESSTSDGILKVFEKAENYQKSNSEDDVLSVVILDEIGLAEISRFNPLKVLHNLLEPEGRHFPNVAVVGISNWSLDASKMNRAIHLSRPDMDVEELTETGISISDSFMTDETVFATTAIADELNRIATAYFNYIYNLRFKNFHGLRDYYSLVKYVSGEISRRDKVLRQREKMNVILKGIERNFGGLQSKSMIMHSEFRTALDFDKPLNTPLVELVRDNIDDRLARHLLLITTGESVLGIVEKQLKGIKREKREIIFGSQFEEDLTDDYNYRILSRIILCMEQGIVLLLKDLENIYGSLYDMLNQNYTVIGNKKNCRVALGPYSNPMCHVHDSFRCIVFVDERNIDYADPPFLNRFEKQYLRFSDIIDRKQDGVIKEIKRWVHGLSTIKEKRFTESDLFPIYNDDLIASLLLQLDKDCSDIDRCQAELLWIIKPEAVIRLSKSEDDQIRASADAIQTKYFKLPVHRGIKGLMEHQFQENKEKADLKDGGLMTIVFTNSNIHTKVNFKLDDKRIQIDKLGAFKSEKQLSIRMQKFWLETECDILFLQCSAIEDEKHIMLAKSVIERHRSDFISTLSSSCSKKHVYLVIHMDQGKGTARTVSQINYLSEWKLVMLDSLECPITPLPMLCDSSLSKIILKMKLNPLIKEQLFWAFTRIKYERIGRDIDSIITVTDETRASPEFLNVLREQIYKWIEENKQNIHNVDWHIHVACDMQALQTSSSFIEALERHIRNVVHVPLTKTIYQMENKGIMDSFFIQDDRTIARRETWGNLLNDTRLFSINDVPNESGPECYQCTTPDLALKMPFSKYIFECTEATREEFIENLIILKGKCELDESEDLPQEVFEKLLLKQKHSILEKLPDMSAFKYKQWEDDYIEDFCNISSFTTCSNLLKQKRIQYMKWAVSQQTDIRVGDPLKLLLDLHTTLWTHSDLLKSELQLLEICCDVTSNEHDDLLQILTGTKLSNETDTASHTSMDIEHSMICEYVSESNETPKPTTPEEYDLAKEGATQNDGQNEEVSTLDADGITVLPLREESDSNNDTNEDEKPTDENQKHELKYKMEENKYSGIPPGLTSDNVLSETVLHLDAKEDESHILYSEDNVGEEVETTDHTDIGYLPAFDSNVSENLSHFQNRSVFALGEREETDELSTEHDTCTGSLSKEAIPWLSSKHRHTDDEMPVVSEQQVHVSQDMLVDHVCKIMLPTSATLEKHNGVQNWQRKINCVLAIAARVSDNPVSLHSLRFCNDMVSGVFLPYSLSDNLLQNVGNLLGENFDMDSEQVFQAIKDIVVKAPSTAHTDCQKMLVNYFLRCLISNPSSNALTYLLGMVSRSEMPENVSHMKSPIHLAFQYEQVDEDEGDTFFNLINAYKATVAQHDSFSLVESFLVDTKTQHKMQSPCVVLFIDILEELYMDILQPDESDNDSNDEGGSDVEEEEEEGEEGVLGMIDSFLKSHDTLISNEFGLDFIASLAFCKAYIHQFFNQTTTIEGMEADKFSAVFAYNDSKIGASLVQYVYKVIARDKLHGHFIKACNQFEKNLPNVKPVKWSEKHAAICFDACPTAVHAPMVIKKVACLFTQSLEDIDMDKVIQYLIDKAVCKGYSEEMMALYSFAINKFYIHRCFNVVEDTMNSLATSVLQIAHEKHMETKRKHLLKCLIGQEDFKVPDLMLEQTSKPEEAIVASFLVSLYAVVLSYTPTTLDGKLPLLVKCLLQISIKGHYIPGFPNNKDQRSTTLKVQCPSKCHFSICLCGHRIVTGSSSDIAEECVFCGRVLKLVESPYAGGYESTEIESGYIVCEEINQPNFSVRELDPVLCNVLNIMIKGCLLGSVALEFMPAHTLQTETGIPEVDGPHILRDHIHIHWRNIAHLLNMDMHGVGMLLHTIVLHTRDFLTQDVTEISNPGERLAWENRFVSKAIPILNQRFQLMMKTVAAHNAIIGCSSETTEQSLHEFNDTTTMEEEERQAFLPILFRLKGNPSKANFMFELHAVQKSFQFLVLTLEHEHDLQLCKHIMSIVRWHIAATANANYLMKKQECLKMTVSDFIHQNRDEDKRKLLKKRFTELQKSWITLKDHAALRALGIELERISSQSNVTECLILNDDSNVYRVLQLLVETQNRFLDKTLELAHVCSSVMFLRREEHVTVIPCVQICEVKPGDLIDFKWDDSRLQFSQCDPLYGQGTHVVYDFQTIERTLAVNIIVGRSYIRLENALPKIMFKDELYKNYTFLVKELKSKVKQSSLTSDIASGVRAKKDSDPRMTTELLTHLGMIMTLLKKTSGDPNKSLVDFVDEWENVLIHKLPYELLPNPVTGVKLTHLVALHELLEELNSDTVREALDKPFRVKLESDMEKHFKRMVAKHPQPAVVLKTIKIFIHRCLYLGDVECDQPLNLYLSDESFWPDGVKVENDVRLGDTVVPLKEVIPGGVMVGNVCDLVDLMEYEIEQQPHGDITLEEIFTGWKRQNKFSAGNKTAKKKRAGAKMLNH